MEREMISDGKSASEIDGAKARIRQQAYSGIPPELNGVGSLSETARNMNRGPRGIAAYMAEGGEAEEEVYDAGGRFQFDQNMQEPSIVSFLRKMFNRDTYDTSLEKARKIKAGEMPTGYEPPGVRLSREFIGMTPIGTAETGVAMYDEFNQDDPNYLKLGIMGAGELAGYIPLAGPPIKKMIRGGRGNVPINKNVFDDSEEIIEVYHATPNAPFEKLDANMSDLNKDGAFGPGDYFSLDSRYPSQFVGGRGSLLSAKVDVSRMLDARLGGKPFTSDQTEGLIEALSRRTDLDGKNLTVVKKDDVLSVSYVRRPLFSGEPLADRRLVQRIPLRNAEEAFKKIKEITNNIKNPLQKDADGYALVRNNSTNTENLKDVLSESGFTGVVGVQEASSGGKSNLVVFDNSVYKDGGKLDTVIDQGVIPEDIGFSASRSADEYTAGNDAKIVENYRRRLEKENVSPPGSPDFRTSEDIELLVQNFARQRSQKYADGGEVMEGIGSLNETARNMTRGPRGLNSLQRFAEGGELNVNLQPLDLPVDGRMSYTKTDDGGMFDSEVSKTFEGGLGSLTPSFDYSTQNSSRDMGDVVIDENGEQIGFAVEGELFLNSDPDSEDKVRGAFEVEKSRNNTNFTFPEGEFVRTNEGLLKRFNLGMDLGRFGLDLNRMEGSGREPVNSGSATIRIGENGIVRYSDSDRGEPTIGFNYAREFASGGPVYMKNGGESSEAKARKDVLNTIYEIESNSNYDQWNLKAKNPPETPLSSLTIQEIMDFQGDENGPAAGAGQIKYNTFKYLIKSGVLSPDDVFSPENQDAANSRLLDRRGFVSWFNGDISTEEFGSDVAKEWASLPLLESRDVSGGKKERGDSRYGGSNKALVGADYWQEALDSAKVSQPTVVASADTSGIATFLPQTETRATQPQPVSYVPNFQGFQMQPSQASSMPGPLEPERPPVEEAKQYASLYEKYTPQAMQDALQGLGYFNSPTGPSGYQQFASGGEALGPPPLRGPDPQGIGAYQQFNAANR